MRRTDSRFEMSAPRWSVWLAAGLTASMFAGPASADESKPAASSASAPTRRALLVCGLPGDDGHRKMYAEAMERLYKVMTERYGFAPGEVLVRFGTDSRPTDGPALKASKGLSTREGLAAEAAELRRRLKPDDTLWVIVLGHGHLDGRHAFLNIPGPDLDEKAFAKLFDGIKAREQVFFITTSASGFFLRPLAAPGRIVITATEADQEVNETLFPLSLTDVLAEYPEGIDRDKDGSVSVFELYLAVVNNVMQRYVDDETLATEHAKLDDNGDGHGSEVQDAYLSPELGGRAGKGQEPKIGPKDDGALSSRVIVGPLAPAGAPAPAKENKKPSANEKTNGK